MRTLRKKRPNGAASSGDVLVTTGARKTYRIGEDLRHLPDTFIHARRALRVMRQNLALSGAILVVLIPLAALGVLGLAAVVAAHELAEVVVIANGVGAGRRKTFRGVSATSMGTYESQPWPTDVAPPSLSLPLADRSRFKA